MALIGTVRAMRRLVAALVPALTLLIVAGCGGGDDDVAAAEEPAATSSSSSTSSAAQPEDVAGRSNCVASSLAYAPIASALGGDVDLEGAIGFFDAADVDPATSAEGKAAAVAITEANYELALAKADLLTGQAIDEAKLRQLLDAVDAACETVVG